MGPPTQSSVQKKKATQSRLPSKGNDIVGKCASVNRGASHGDGPAYWWRPAAQPPPGDGTQCARFHSPMIILRTHCKACHLALLKSM